MSAILSDVHPTLRELIELSKKRKWISYDELNTALPDEMVDPEKLDELLSSIEDLGVEFINEEIVRRHDYQTFQAPLQTNLRFKRDDPSKGVSTPKVRIEQEEAAGEHPIETEMAEAQRRADSEAHGEAEANGGRLDEARACRAVRGGSPARRERRGDRGRSGVDRHGRGRELHRTP